MSFYRNRGLFLKNIFNERVISLGYFMLVCRKKKLYLRIGEGGSPIVCGKKEAKVFDEIKAQNVLDHLPKALQKMNFVKEPVVQSELNISDEEEIPRKKIVIVEKTVVKNTSYNKKTKKVIKNTSYKTPQNVMNWVDRVTQCNDLFLDAEERRRELLDCLSNTDKNLSNILHKIELEDDMNSLYGTPLESTTYKFAKSLKNRFGKDVFVKIDGKDRNYITNSYHIPVFEPITAFEKLRIESKFQKLSPGGAISYIEIPSMTHNIPAILEVIKFIYNNIMYAEINTKNCYCEKCGFDGDIPLVKDEDGILKWKCPNCDNTDNTTMDIAFRVCGYIGTAKNGGNQGRYGDIHDRVYHLDDTEYEE